MVSIGMTLLTLLGLIVIIYLLNRFFRWLDKKLTSYEKSIQRKRKSWLRYLSPKGPEYFFQFVFRIVRYALIILIILLYLPLLFSFLPWTKEIVQTFYSYIANPVKSILSGLYEFLPDLFFIVIIVIIARYVVRVLTYMATEVEGEHLKIKGFHRDWAKPTLNIAKVIVYAFAIVFMFPYLPGSDSEAFKGVSIFLGILFSLGSTSAIANIVAGIVITYMRPFMIGDRVKIGETVGDVVEKTMLVTRIRTLKNEDVTIPNATIINGQLWNYTKNAKEIGVILHTSITLGYDVPWKEVNRLLLLAARNTKNLTRDFKPFVLQKSLNDFYVEYELNVYTKQPDKMMHFYSELHRNILEVFNEAGIEILSPHYQANRDGNASTIQGAEPPVPDTRNPVEKIIDTATGKNAGEAK
jgi:small-conductance mechanosensitive channel